MIQFLLCFFFSLSVFAAPKEVEVWFLSNQKTSQLDEILNRPSVKFRTLTAELQCQPMGDYCFDPQYGLYKKDDASAEMVAADNLEKDGPSIPSGKSVERDLINCDPKNYFDVFCGKARKEPEKQANLEIWIDTSSSMKEFDYSDKEGGCYRKSLIKQLDDTCGFNQKVNVMMFDTSIKEAGSMLQLCNNQGLNDYKRLIDWIERSNARKLIVVTDIYEFHKEFSDYIEGLNGKFRGDKDPLTAKDMLNLVDELAKSCK